MNHGEFIPATPHEESVGRLFQHRDKARRPDNQIPPPSLKLEDLQKEPIANPEAMVRDPALLDHYLAQRYSYHPPAPSQIDKFNLLRQMVLENARLLVKLCPPCNELERALDGLDAVLMFGNAAIARQK